MSVIGLDIGSSTMKAVELSGTRGSLRVEGVVVEPTPENTFVNGVIIDAETLGAGLANMIRNAGFRTRKVVSSLGGQTQLVVRVTEVPRMAEKQLRDAMKWDVERHIPFPATNIVMDFAPIEPPDEDPSTPNMEILLAVAQEEYVANHLKVLSAAGLEPQAIDIEQLAGPRALLEGRTEPPRERCVAVVNVGAELTDICIVQDGLLRFPRSIPLAGESFTTAIGQSFVVDAQEAENLKRQFGTVSLEAHEEAAAEARMPPVGRMAYDWVEEGGDTVQPIAVAEQEAAEPTVDIEPEAPPEPVLMDTVEGPVFGEEEPAAGEPTLIESVEGPVFEEPAAPGAPPVGPGRGAFLETEDMVSDMGPGRPTDPEQARAQVAETLTPVLVELAGEIRRSIEYYRSKHEDVDVEKVLLIGGSAKIENLPAFLERELGIPVELANVFEGLEWDRSVYSDEYMRDIGPIVAVSVGLAMRDLL